MGKGIWDGYSPHGSANGFGLKKKNFFLRVYCVFRGILRVRCVFCSCFGFVRFRLVEFSTIIFIFLFSCFVEIAGENRVFGERKSCLERFFVFATDAEWAVGSGAPGVAPGLRLFTLREIAKNGGPGFRKFESVVTTWNVASGSTTTND
ncbi:MAG: hypothetical protein JWM99_460 [Verrucomicrobiales bacterium]|nr:hypothetical protein [Verrucomicrobiales bacterium]